MNKEAVEDVLSYLVTSARGCIDEPPLYGPVRLLDAFSKLVSALDEDLDPFFQQEKSKIDAFKYDAMYDEKAFTDGIDGSVLRLAKYFKNK